MYFGTESYLKSNCYHTTKQELEKLSYEKPIMQMMQA
jgi:hypothetical protein